jgi:hypothetical protein
MNKPFLALPVVGVTFRRVGWAIQKIIHKLCYLSNWKIYPTLLKCRIGLIIKLLQQKKQIRRFAML